MQLHDEKVSNLLKPLRGLYKTVVFFQYLFLISDNLRTLLTCLDDTQLANFCRILAVAISDLDIYENKSSCKRLNFHLEIYLTVIF